MTDIIIDIEQLLDSRRRKEEELEFYKSKLEELRFKMSYIQHDIRITNIIIDIIEKEKVIEVKPK